MSITTPPPVPLLTDDADTFNSKAFAFVEWLETFTDEINLALPALFASDGGLPISFAITFSTTTTDSDPGAGKIRFNNATQTSATQFYIDLTSADAGNPDITALLDWLDDSTSSSSKGVIKLFKTSDTSKWLFANLTAWTTATGYRKLTVSVLAANAVNPFSDLDALTFQFWRTGDAGVAGDLNNADLTNIRTATFKQVLSTGATTGTIGINWTLATNYAQAEPTGDITYTFTPPPGPGHLQIIIASDGSSTSRNVSFSGSTLRWLGAQFTATTANKAAVLNFFYDGSVYWAQGIAEA